MIALHWVFFFPSKGQMKSIGLHEITFMFVGNSKTVSTNTSFCGTTRFNLGFRSSVAPCICMCVCACLVLCIYFILISAKHFFSFNYYAERCLL